MKTLRALALVATVLPCGCTRTRAEAPLFVESAAAAGLVSTHVNGASGKYYLPEPMGAGAALFDYDGDGDLDVFLVQAGTLDGAAGAATPTSKLFRNDLAVAKDGRRTLRFTDVTARAGVGLRAYGMGAAVADYDGDGDLDLLVTSLGPETLYRNNGDGTFSDVTREAGVSDPLWSTSAAFLDYDRDGDLDLFVANYVDFSVAGNKRCTDALGARDYCGPRSYHPVPDRLYRNEGNGRFSNVTESAGIAKADGNGLGVVAGDYNGDGWLDLYVANDATPNQLWINRKDGTFVDEGLLSGSALNAAGNPEGSMGIASGDFDGDGDEDLFITNIAGETYALYVNDGKGNFEDARVRAGLAAPTAAFTGFGTDWFDYDNDGWLDLFVANGAVNVIEAQRGEPAPFRMRNQLFRNTGAGRFAETSQDGGPAFARAEISRAAAFGDVDDDGDTDILVTTNGGPVRLLLNQADRRNHWLQVTLEQAGANRRAFGARIGVLRANRPTLWRRVKTDGSYLSASDPRAHFGLGTSAALDAVVVQWPEGQQERFSGVAADRLVTLRRGTGGPLENQHASVSEVLRQLAVTRRQAPAPKARMRDEQPVEGVPRPAQLERMIEPARARRVVEQPALVPGQLGDRRAALETQAPHLHEDLQLEQAGRRDVQLPGATREWPAPGMPPVKPEHGVRVEEDQARRRRAAKRSFPDSRVQDQLPASTAGSTNSISPRPRTERERRGGRTAWSRNRTPRRSITTGSPRSAPSSASASRRRTCATV